MTSPGDGYRQKAMEVRARARGEANADIRAELEALASSYLLLAGQADRNSLTDIFYETPPPPKTAEDPGQSP